MNNCEFSIFFYVLFFEMIVNISRGNNTITAVSCVLILLMVVICREEIGGILFFCLFPVQRILMISKGFMTVISLISIFLRLKISEEIVGKIK